MKRLSRQALRWIAQRFAWVVALWSVHDLREEQSDHPFAPPLPSRPPATAPPATRIEVRPLSPARRWKRAVQRLMRRSPRAAHEDESARWHFRGAILDRLDEYFVCIRRLRRHDPPSYALFSRLGFAIASDRYIVGPVTMQDVSRFKRITFGGVLLPQSPPGKLTSRGERWISPSFFYFTKLKHPVGVAARRGDIYRLSVLYDDRDLNAYWRSKLSTVCNCHIVLQPTGEMTLLREVHTAPTRFQVGGTKKRKQHKQTVEFTSRCWRYPGWLDGVAHDHDQDPEQWATDLLSMAIQTYLSATEKIVIRVKRAGVVASFGIDVARCKYFFADRKTEALATDGRRKRIFHAVTGHTRRLADGRVTTVRDHYRGARAFSWNDSTVKIVFPTNTRILHFDAPAEEFAEGASFPSGMLTPGQVGARLGTGLEQ